jgi:selenocysteine-specific elongation factor
MDLAKALERSGRLVVINADLAYPADVWNDIQHRVVELISTRGPATVSQVREVVGTSRKYAVPVLERLDATGVTRRRGDVRELGPRGRELV